MCIIINLLCLMMMPPIIAVDWNRAGKRQIHKWANGQISAFNNRPKIYFLWWKPLKTKGFNFVAANRLTQQARIAAAINLQWFDFNIMILLNGECMLFFVASWWRPHPNTKATQMMDAFCNQTIVSKQRQQQINELVLDHENRRFPIEIRFKLQQIHGSSCNDGNKGELWRH